MSRAFIVKVLNGRSGSSTRVLCQAANSKISPAATSILPALLLSSTADYTICIVISVTPPTASASAPIPPVTHPLLPPLILSLVCMCAA